MTSRAGVLWGRWVAVVSRHALAVALLCLLATLGAAWHVVAAFDISTDNTDMLSPELPFRQRMIDMKRLFPTSGDDLLVVVEGQSADRVADGTADLVARMSARPDLFRSVFEPGSDPFFQRNGMLYLETDRLRELSQRLVAAQPFLGTLWRDPSLAALWTLLNQALTEAEKGDTPIELDPVLNAIAAVAEDRTATLSWTDLMGSGRGAADRRRLILAQPALDYGSLAPAGPALRFVRAQDLGSGVTVHLTGSVALDHEELGSVEEGMGWAGVVSLVLVLGLLGWCLKSARLVLALLLTLIAGLIWTASFAFLVVGQLNLISVAFAVLFIGLSVDFGIHFSLRYLEERQTTEDHRAALLAAAVATGGPLTLCAVAAAMAFFAFLPTDYIGLAQLGLIAGSGMFIALGANLTLLPALMTLMPVRGSPRKSVARIGRPAARLVLGGALLVAVVAAPLALRVQFDFDPLHLKDPTTDSVATLERLMGEGEIHPYTLTILHPDLAAAEALAKRLRATPGLGNVRTLADYLPKDQPQKLAIIDGLTWTVGLALTGPRQPTTDPAALKKARERLLAQLKTASDESAARLYRALAALGDADGADLEKRLLSGLEGRLQSLKLSLEAAPVTLADLPKVLRQREQAIDGRVRVQVALPEGDSGRAALLDFVARVRTVAPEATGTPVTIIEAGNAVIESFQIAGGLTFAGVVLLLLGVLKRGRDVLWVLLPLLLAAELTAAGSVLFNLPFNFANVIVLPLLAGLGVASGIHLVTRAREPGDGGSTPRAVTFSALTTIGSFGSIALSSHPGTASMGLLLTLAIALTLACTMTVIPALFEVTEG
ncbi:MMPL family transporter [Magnetospira thiophila]